MSVFIDEGKCKGCGICTQQCPANAISLKSGIAKIDQNSCVECLNCMDSCPIGAIYQILDEQPKNLVPQKAKTSEEREIFWPPQRKQQIIEIGGNILSGLYKLAGNFIRNRFNAGRKDTGNRLKRRRRVGRRGKKGGRGRKN